MKMRRMGLIRCGRGSSVLRQIRRCGAANAGWKNWDCCRGTRIQCLYQAPCGTPAAYAVSGVVFALWRKGRRAAARGGRLMSCPEAAPRAVALAGNPNVGKSSSFNALTGLHQRTGNWPGKTVAVAQGGIRPRRRALCRHRPAGGLLPHDRL